MVKVIGTYAQNIIKLLSKNYSEEQNNISNYDSTQWQEVLFNIIASNHTLLNKLGVSIPEI